MNGREFKLGTFAKSGGKPFAAIVLGDSAFDLGQAASASGKSLGATSIQGLLEDWDRNFATLQEIAAFLDKEKKPGDAVTSLTAHPPVARPGKMFYAAQNFQEHVDEMIRAGMSPKDNQWKGEKEKTQPYLFLKAPSCLAGANDDIPVPSDVKKVDWEAEIACAITKPAKRVKAEKALDHIAGWMTTNDVSARDLQVRQDRPGLRSDWLNGKSHDKFAPMGPYLVPKAFVKDHMKLFIRLSINGNVKQNGNTSQFIFTPEEQIEYASNILTLQTGDIFVCGTCGGVGQGTNTFINVGDVMETEVEGLGKMRNKFVAEKA
jgi:2-keto-4-pentenoate hydratase/2-oxohepta-3-ene-1,7-dioic acid hydratase in catechol pathway